MSRLFGTDGVRGVANRDLTAELAFALGRAAAQALAVGPRPRIVVGRDTRASGEMLQAALSAGISSAGGDAVRIGVIPTPGVAFLARDLEASAGAVISASHNPAEDNGIKFFSGDGYKLPDDVEDEIERLALEGNGPRPTGGDIGRVRDRPEAAERYAEHVAGAVPASLDGMRVVVDCAHGAAFRLAPQVLRRLGADVHVLNDRPDGTNINEGCGATHPEVVARAVRELGADAGVAHDGDADRAIFADERGEIVDGDQVIAACALAMKEAGTLAKDIVVVTPMSNLGFRRAMDEAAIRVVEARVGDRYVLEEMRRTGAVLGGEQSGHVIFLDRSTTGDGLLTAARFLALAADSGRRLSEVASAMTRYPQVLENVGVSDASALEGSGAVAEAVAEAEAALGDRGRVLVRASGTEPLVRVMVEAQDEADARAHAARIASAVRTALASA